MDIRALPSLRRAPSGGERASARRHRTAGVAAFSALSLGLAACGGSSTSSSPSSSSSSSTGGSTAISQASLQELASYTGSTLGAANSSLSPITLGYVNEQGGALSFPEYTTDAQALVTLINTKLGGISGHPVKLTTCFVISSDEEGQACGQQFANDKSIKAILQFPLVNGGTAFHRVIDPTKLPVFGPIGSSPADFVSPTAFFSSAAAISTVPILAQYAAKTLKAKSVAIVGLTGNPLSQLVTSQLTAALKADGVSAKLAAISPTSNDATSALIAAGAQHADVILATLSDDVQCDSVAKTLKSLDLSSKTKVVTLGFCADPAVKQALGDYPQWTFLQGYPSTYTTPIDAREAAEVKVENEFFASIGSPTDTEPDVPVTLSGVLPAIREINKAGGASATSAEIVKAADADPGPLFLGPPQLDWGTPPLVGVGTLDQRLITYEGNNKWVDATGGWYSGPTMGAP